MKLRTVRQEAVRVVLILAVAAGGQALLHRLDGSGESRPDELAAWPDGSEQIREAWLDVMSLEELNDARGVERWHGDVFDSDPVHLRRLRASLQELRAEGLTEVRVVRFTKNTPLAFDPYSDLRSRVRGLKNPVPLYSVRFHAPGSREPGRIWNTFVISSGGGVRHVDLP